MRLYFAFEQSEVKIRGLDLMINPRTGVLRRTRPRVTGDLYPLNSHRYLSRRTELKNGTYTTIQIVSHENFHIMVSPETM